MQSVVVRGRFISEDKEPMVGVVRFTPSRLAIEFDDTLVATLAHEVELQEGSFEVLLTRTDQDETPWFYTVECPIGKWSIQVASRGPLMLKNLLPNRFA